MPDTETRLLATSLDHVVLHVKDLERSKRFYIDLLGFELDREHLASDETTTPEEEFDANVRSFLRCGKNQLGLFQRSLSDVGGGVEVNHLALTIENSDHAEVRAILEAAGVEIRGRAGDPDCIYISDPDGHNLQLLPGNGH